VSSAAPPPAPAERLPVAAPPAVEPAAPPSAAAPELAELVASEPPADALVPPVGLDASPAASLEVRASPALELRVLVAQPAVAATAAANIATTPICLTHGQAAAKGFRFCIMRAYS
jgi:hypothetical protein